MKVVGANPLGKIISIVMILLPLSLIICIIVIRSSYSVIYTKGYFVFFIFYSIFSFYYLKWTVFNASIHKKEDICIIHTGFKKIVYSKIHSVSVKPILVLSFLFKIYSVEINNDRFQVGSSTSQTFLDRIFKQKQLAHEMQSTLEKHLL